MLQGKLAALEETIRREHSNITGLVVMKNGAAAYEKYFNGCTAASRIHVYSVTKSIVSILLGMAMEKGGFQSTGQRVLDFFPEYEVKKGETTIQAVTLEHLLTMTAPYKYKWFAPYVPYFTSDDWVRFTLDLLGGKGRPGRFRYAPLIGPDVLSGGLIKATGRPVREFAQENLFSPLGITVGRSLVFQSKEEQMAFNKATDISGWAADAAGTNAAGWGLTLSPMDLAKLGQLYLNGGRWNGAQLVPARWVAESTRQHSRWQKQDLAYGYLWWVLDEGEHAYAALGDGGNALYVNEKKGLVVAITALFAPRAKDRVEFIRKHIEPLFEGGEG